jgi:hypothetical protein
MMNAGGSFLCFVSQMSMDLPVLVRNPKEQDFGNVYYH